MKDLLKKYWWGILIAVLAPIVINYILLIPTIGPVVGDNTHWLSFWGSYLAALIPSAGAFLILYLQREDNHQENEQNRKLQINVLKYQQEMQWLNEKRQILLDFSMALSRDDLVELTNKIGQNQDILLDVKRLLAHLVQVDSQVGFMRVSAETEQYKEFDAKRRSAFSTRMETLLDLQEVNFLFLNTSAHRRQEILNDHIQRGLIHKGLKDIISTYPSNEVFLLQKPFDISNKLISNLPNLLEGTRKAALTYVKSEEERIIRLLEEES